MDKETLHQHLLEHHGWEGQSLQNRKHVYEIEFMKARNLKYHARPTDCLPESDGWRCRHDYQLLFGNMSHVLLPSPSPHHR